MPSPKRVILAIAVGISAGLILLVTDQVVRNYPAADGISMADGQLLGGDFIAFYVGGRLFDTDRARLYDLEHQRESRTLILGPAANSIGGELPFVYPPLVAALVSPFSRLAFQRAFFLWTLFGLIASLGGLLLLMRLSGATGVLPLPLLVLSCFAFVPYSMNTLLGGQASWLGICILAAVSLAILNERDSLAGAALSLSYYKPPLFLLLLVVLSLARGRRFLLGFASGAAVLVSLTLLLVGAEGAISFMSTVSRYIYGQEVLPGVELPPGEGMGLVALGVSLLPSVQITLTLLLLASLVPAWVGYRLIAARAYSHRMFGMVLCVTASLAFSIQIIKYDLALLLVPMVLGLSWQGTECSPRKTLALLPFLGFFFEFPFRRMSLGASVFNASSLLFLAVLLVLTWQGWRILKTSEVDGHTLRRCSSTEGER